MKIEFYVPASEHPIVTELLKKINNKMFGSINSIMNSNIQVVFENKDLTSFIEITLSNDATVSDLKKIVDVCETWINTEYNIPTKNIYFKIND